MRLYKVKIRLKGSISYLEVLASSAGKAKELVLAQFGKQVTVLQVNPV
jgi:hypothetical protein